MPLFTKHTMTPEEEALWEANEEYSFPVPSRGHVIHVLRQSGLTWSEVSAALGIAGQRQNPWHDTKTCLWCLR